jgi:hypothetical protein
MAATKRLLPQLLKQNILVHNEKSSNKFLLYIIDFSEASLETGITENASWTGHKALPELQLKTAPV